MIGPCASATATAPCWSTWSGGGRWRCCPTARRALWRHGCASIPASRSWRATAPAPTPTAREAAQVADRIHLPQNLAEALETTFTAHAGDLRAVERARHREAVADGDPVPVAPPRPPARAATLAA